MPTAWMRHFSIRLRMNGAIAMVLGLFALLCSAGLWGGTQLEALQQHQAAAAVQAKADLGALRAALDSAARAGDAAAASAALTSARQAADALDRSDAAAAQDRNGIHDTLLATFRACAAVLLLVALIVVPLTLLNAQSIIAPIRQARELAMAIAAGDLTGRVGTDGADEAAELLRALQHMQGALGALVSDVRQASGSIHVSSNEVASGNLDLSGRTEQAASQLQRTSSAMQQLTQNVRHSADAAEQANTLADSAQTVATRGGEAVSRVVSTMDEINASSHRIGDIVGTIDSIAFQTNILALNAAVEAARAGEQGRGFAVVAAEVRSLAQRSAAAAREIKTLIAASVERVESGAHQVRDAGATMGEIVASVQRVSDIIREITRAAGEQSQGIGDINSAVGQLDGMTQQNAALVEQSAAAAESLKDQASRLAEMVSRFKLAVA